MVTLVTDGWSGWMACEGVGLIVHEYKDFQTYVVHIHQRYIQTDRQHAMARPRFAQ